jgi:hypothetical protein
MLARKVYLEYIPGEFDFSTVDGKGDRAWGMVGQDQVCFVEKPEFLGVFPKSAYYYQLMHNCPLKMGRRE